MNPFNIRALEEQHARAWDALTRACFERLPPAQPEGGAAVNLREWLNDKAAQAAGVRREMLEQMAAAYCLKTDIPPDEVVLIEEQKGAVLTWRFERRTPEVPR